MTPIVKWVGGKTRLLPDLLQRLPSGFNRYYEPFAGGAALFFRVQPASAVLGDMNADLIGAYRAVASDVEAVIAALEVHAVAHSETHYYAIRKAFSGWELSGSDRAAAFLYLNRVCFNGLYRVNSKGEFNVAFGRYASPTICDAEKLRAASAVLARADLRHGDYRTTLQDACDGDLVYLDPPYDATFNAYTAESFDQAALARFVRALQERGCHVVVSNSSTALVHELYVGNRIDVVRCPRAINSNAAGRGEVDEVIVVAPRRPARRMQLNLFDRSAI